jgi:hypothetical protein
MGQVEDAKWRQRWQNMMRSMREAKGSDRAVAFSPSHIVEASSKSQKNVSPHNLSSTTLHASSHSHSRPQICSDSPSHSRSRIFNDGAIAHTNGDSVASIGAGGAEHWYGGIRNTEKAKTPLSFGKRDAQGAQIGATKCQEETPEQAKTREREERARARQQLQFEIERERERTQLRENALESRNEGEWERAQERLESSSEDGTKVLWAGKERESGGMARGDQFGEGDGQNHSWNAAGMPSILRKFELEQVRFVSMKEEKMCPLI